MKRSALLILAAAAFAACAQNLTPQERAVEEEAVRTRLQAWDRAMNNRLLDSLAAIYDHSAGTSVAWAGGPRARGWDQVQTAMKDFFGSMSYMNFGVQDPVIDIVSPTVAVATFRHSTDVITSGVRQPVTNGQATLVWLKDPSEQRVDQRWKLHTVQVSVTPAAAPTAQQAAPATRRR
jgi:ketosteroid isomerase-like protein